MINITIKCVLNERYVDRNRCNGSDFSIIRPTAKPFLQNCSSLCFVLVSFHLSYVYRSLPAHLIRVLFIIINLHFILFFLISFDIFVFSNCLLKSNCCNADIFSRADICYCCVVDGDPETRLKWSFNSRKW